MAAPVTVAAPVQIEIETIGRNHRATYTRIEFGCMANATPRHCTAPRNCILTRKPN